MEISRRPSRPLLIGAFALLCLIWGTTWTAIQIGLRGVPPFTGVALRFAIAALLLSGLCWKFGVRLGKNRHEWFLWGVNGVLGFSVSYGVVYWCEQWIPSGLASVLFATYPLFVAVLAHFTLPGERIGWLEGIGILVGFSGVAVIFSRDLTPAAPAAAAVIMLASPMAAASASVAIKRWGTGLHPFSLAAVPMGITALVMTGMALGFEQGRGVTWTPAAVGSMLYMAIFGSVITFSLYYWLLRHLPAKRMALVAYVVPVIAVAIGWLRDEALTARMLIGSAIVLAAVSLVARAGAVELHE